MPWYRTGTITVTNGSLTVTGSGTSWILNAASGEAVYAPDGKLYEIDAIVSATSLTLKSAYLGTTQSGQAYQILPSQSYIRDLAAQVATLVDTYNNTVAALSNAGSGRFTDGTVGAPGVAFTSDTDVGLRRAGTNDMRLVAGGVDQVTVNTTGLLVTDAKLGITGSSDATKIARFEVDGFTTATTRTFTLPNASDTVVTLAATQTLTNKTLTSPTITGGTSNPTTLQEGGVAAVVEADVGTDPNEIPLNQYLGLMAFRDTPTVPVPATAAATGRVGDVAVDASFVYVCTAANTWKRASIVTW